jgi:hypothetical protein
MIGKEMRRGRWAGRRDMSGFRLIGREVYPFEPCGEANFVKLV